MKITREVAKELLPIVKALAEGKMIQDKIEGLTGWVDTDEINLEFEGKKILHRIKPEPKYRPFKTQEECWDEMLKHQPFGWIKAKDSGSPILIGNIYLNIDEEVYIVRAYNGVVNSASDAFYNFTFADGTPFGIKED